MKGGANYHASACEGRVGLVLGLDGLDKAECERLLGCLFAITDGERLIDPHRLVADRGD